MKRIMSIILIVCFLLSSNVNLYTEESDDFLFLDVIADMLSDHFKIHIDPNKLVIKYVVDNPEIWSASISDVKIGDVWLMINNRNKSVILYSNSAVFLLYVEDSSFETKNNLLSLKEWIYSYILLN